MPSSERLVHKLHNLGLHAFPETSSLIPAEKEISAEQLLVGLAEHEDARMRRMLLPLFLYRPELSELVPDVLCGLNASGQVTLKLFYTAAVFLQQVHEDQLKERVPHWCMLPDYFSAELDVSAKENPIERLELLGKRHRNLTGKTANWLGSYQHAANRLIARLAKEAEDTG
ncbi:MAG: hypothetical protein KGY39_03155 [Anaerolineales bacterium]|nr:hypothetical protein [Anaerolineales bacterium]